MDAVKQNSVVMVQAAPSPHLLSLPRELRNQIYTYILVNCRTTPPVNPSYPGDRILRENIDHPKTYRSWRYPSLVWASRQLRYEYFDLVEKCSRNYQIKAELDIMSRGYKIWPTWIFLPPDLLGDGPFDLDVNLRIFTTEAFISHGGWPNSPGFGFVWLLKLLSQLVHHGPSFGHHLELLRGKWLFAINILTVNITFHDYYTRATWPETAHNIFRMLKALATHGVARNIIQKIHAHVEFEHDKTRVCRDREWDVSQTPNPDRTAEWKDLGFLTRHQDSLSDDYRSGVSSDYL